MYLFQNTNCKRLLYKFILPGAVMFHVIQKCELQTDIRYNEIHTYMYIYFVFMFSTQDRQTVLRLSGRVYLQ